MNSNEVYVALFRLAYQLLNQYAKMRTPDGWRITPDFEHDGTVSGYEIITPKGLIVETSVRECRRDGVVLNYDGAMEIRHIIKQASLAYKAHVASYVMLLEYEADFQIDTPLTVYDLVASRYPEHGHLVFVSDVDNVYKAVRIGRCFYLTCEDTAGNELFRYKVKYNDVEVFDQADVDALVSNAAMRWWNDYLEYA